MLLFRLKHEKIEPLLQERGRNLIDVVSLLVLMIPESAAYFSSAMYDGRIFVIIMAVTFILQYLSMVMFFMVYQDMTDCLTRDLQTLRRAVADLTLEWEDLKTARWELRDRIREANDLFALLLSFFYLQVSSTTVFVAAESIVPNFGLYVESLLLLSYFCFLLTVSILAHKASHVMIFSKDLEREFSESLSRSAMVDCGDSLAVRVFEF